MLAILPLASANTLAKWTFETSRPYGFRSPGTWFTNVVAEIGSGTASAFHSGVGLYSAGPGNGSSSAFGVTNSWTVGDFFQFAVSTTGHQGISLSYDQAGTAHGPGTFFLAYSTDGSSFTQFGSNYQVLLGNWSPFTPSTANTFVFDLSSLTSLNNQPIVYFRIVDASSVAIDGGTVNGYEDDRIDNFVISAQLVPEPGTTVLAVLGGVCSLLLSARKRLGTR